MGLGDPMGLHGGPIGLDFGVGGGIRTLEGGGETSDLIEAGVALTADHLWGDGGHNGRYRAATGTYGAVTGSYGAAMGTYGVDMEHMGQPWGHMGRPQSHMGWPQLYMGQPWAHMGQPWGHMGQQ